MQKGFNIQGGFFNWPPPKNHKLKKKIEYTDWPPPKSSKCQPVSNWFWTGPPLKFLSMGITPCSILCYQTFDTWMKRIGYVWRGCDVLLHFCSQITNLGQDHKTVQILLPSKVPPSFARQALALFFMWRTALLIWPWWWLLRWSKKSSAALSRCCRVGGSPW